MKKNISKKEIVKMLLNKDLDTLDEEELFDLLIDQPIAIDIDKQMNENITFGDKLADKFNSFCRFLEVYY